MARLAYFDCPSGASGDMILGALVDAGAGVDRLREELRRLPLPGWELAAREVQKGAFRATKVDVLVEAGAHRHHRNVGDILGLLEGSSLAEAVKTRAAAIFTRLAQAEARVHGTAPDEVHFHEVGAVDAIIDVTGAVVGLALLEVDAVHVSALPVGGGMVRGAHGAIPVPGPGTAELLRGFPVYDNGIRAELVTPTGAAILTGLAAGAGRMPAMTVERVGYGAGTRDLAEQPNVLRCFLGTAGTRPGEPTVDQADGGVLPGDETIVQVEATIDDMSPQLYEPLMDRLFAAGALDVCLTPVIMKRSRPGVVLTALCRPEGVNAVTRTLFEESTTIGVRWAQRRRRPLPRETVVLATAYGEVPFKVSRLAGRVVTVTPEFADVVRIARERGLPVRDVLDRVRAEGQGRLGRGPGPPC